MSASADGSLFVPQFISCQFDSLQGFLSICHKRTTSKYNDLIITANTVTQTVEFNPSYTDTVLSQYVITNTADIDNTDYTDCTGSLSQLIHISAACSTILKIFYSEQLRILDTGFVCSRTIISL